jgi:hypothetical protein
VWSERRTETRHVPLIASIIPAVQHIRLCARSRACAAAHPRPERVRVCGRPGLRGRLATQPARPPQRAPLPQRREDEEVPGNRHALAYTLAY